MSGFTGDRVTLNAVRVPAHRLLTRVGRVQERVATRDEPIFGDQVHRRYGAQLTPRTTVIITGDARNNYRPPRDAVLADVEKAARAVIWLNPEPHAYWDTGDSMMSAYGRHCTSVHEVRTLRQLEEFVEQMALPGRSGR